ncbi:hypothetical protein MMC07_002733 [Pseudocyphellaria aurata]|nr:hypothetical protein [Pseudocyphellaria aurata]
MSAPKIPGYALVWLDEVDGASGAAVDGSKWYSKTSPNSNKEVQQSTNWRCPDWVRMAQMWRVGHSRGHQRIEHEPRYAALSQQQQRRSSIGSRIDFNRNDYHTWTFEVDRTARTFPGQKLKWFLDGNSFFEITGATVINGEQWNDVAHKLFFPINNLAVGGDYPGPPKFQTVDKFQKRDARQVCGCIQVGPIGTPMIVEG